MKIIVSYSKIKRTVKYSIEGLLFFCLFLNFWNITHIIHGNGISDDTEIIDFFTGEHHYTPFVIAPIPDVIFNVIFCGIIIWNELDCLNEKYHFIKLIDADKQQNLRGDKQ